MGTAPKVICQFKGELDCGPVGSWEVGVRTAGAQWAGVMMGAVAGVQRALWVLVARGSGFGLWDRKLES